ncbi:hypothetical protein HYU08_00695 [Candidatus Woesearchaeota archaeon]|nr:hypothetical protein [Candidatus Woesearchaeota archaeon]
MVKREELQVLIRDYFRFEKQEISFLIPALLLTAFMFSFNDWGDTEFDIALGIKNFLIALIIVAFSVLARLSWQKIDALKKGYKAEFKGWWTGIIIALIITLISKGKVTPVLMGSVVASFMVRHRLGSFRYGFSYFENALISFWGIIANLILSLIFAVALYFFPENTFFQQALRFNWIMALCSILPLPQLDGLNIYFGSRGLYYLTIVIVAIAGILLLTQTQLGLILAVLIAAISAVVLLLANP